MKLEDMRKIMNDVMIQCPNCKQWVTASKDKIISGNCICPKCKKPIRFSNKKEENGKNQPEKQPYIPIITTIAGGSIFLVIIALLLFSGGKEHENNRITVDSEISNTELNDITSFEEDDKAKKLKLRKKREQEAYLRAKNGTLKDCRYYLSKYSYSENAKEIRKQKNELEAYRKAVNGSSYECEAYLQNFPKGKLSWAAWIIGRLGGWNGYASQCPAGPITMSNGLRRFQKMYAGWEIAKMCI